MSAELSWTLLRRVTLRHWRSAPKQTLLLVAILALGVAVFVSVRLANRAAVSSFTHFTETLTGQSDWIINAPAGTLPDSVLAELRGEFGAEPVHIIPVVEVSASPPATGEEAQRYGRPSYTLLGLDLVSLGNLARPGQKPVLVGAGSGDAGGRSSFWSTFSGEPRLWVSAAFAKEPPAEIELVVDETVKRIRVAGTFPIVPDAPAAPATLMVLDLPQLQRLAGKEGRLDRVEFLVEAGPLMDERRSAVRSRLEQLGRDGERWVVTAPGARREAAETMTRAFRLNLTVLSLIALLVGLYLIFQALDGAVVRRRVEISILRSLGVEERVIRNQWLLESAVLGIIGSALGLGLGWVGAQGSVRAVAQTVNALYFGTTVDAANLAAGEGFVGLALGVGAALIAGWWPARDAARTPPAHVLQRSAPPGAGARILRNWELGVALLVAGWACTQVPPLRFESGARFPLAGYATALLWIFGSGLLCAFLLPPLGRAFRGVRERSAPARIALSHISKPSGRHRLAAAALVCAIGMTSGMAILVASFEETMQGWIRRTLQADLYVSSSGAQSASARNTIGADAAARIMSHAAVEKASALVSYPVVIEGKATLLNGADISSRQTRPDTSWIGAPRDDAVFDRARNQGLALVSESFSERFQRKVGDRVRVPTPTGARELEIAGIYADYGNERGSVLVDRVHVREWFGEEVVTSVALFVRPGVDAETLRAALLKDFPGLSVFTNGKLRDEVLRIFRQTFSITYALEVIGVLVAVVGLALTLSSVLLDRRDELTTLRALGFTRAEMARATCMEGAALSFCAVFAGFLLSFALGWLLIHVINKQSFGWTLGFAVPGWQLAALASAVLVTGAVVSYLVGRWAADLPADREEE